MAINHLVFSPEQTRWIADLRELAGFTEDETLAILIAGGLDALRWRCAETLYTTRPMAVSEVAERVHLERGACIEHFHRNGIAPWASPDETAAVFATLDTWLAEDLVSGSKTDRIDTP